MATDEAEARLQTHLEAAYRRAAAATPGSPEWDAAMGGIDALESQLHALRPPAYLTSRHVVSRLGPMILEDGCTVHGTITAPGPDGEALRFEISAIPDRVHSQHEFADELAALVQRADFVREIECHELDLIFYAWDAEQGRPAAPRSS